MLAIAPKESRPNQDVCEPRRHHPNWGGRRLGAGRPKGSKDKLLTLVANRPANVSPIDFLLSIMRDESQPMKVRLRVAARLLPYFHPKLKATAIQTETKSRPKITFVSQRN